MELQDAFTTAGARTALKRYARAVKSRAWSIEHKVDLYGHAQSAFGGSKIAREQRFAEFAEVYRNLRAYWQIFRGAKRRLDAVEVFQLLERISIGSRASGVSLLNFHLSDNLASVSRAVDSLAPIKVTSSGAFPLMTVSKILHFFNPALFPIYDTQVIWNQVFRKHRPAWRRFCNSEGIRQEAEGAEWYLAYMRWGNQLLRTANADFMKNFEEWMEGIVPPDRAKDVRNLGVRGYYATAFEFSIIGASVDDVEDAAIPVTEDAVEVTVTLPRAVLARWGSVERVAEELRRVAARDLV
jgi:hypothetical protein